MCDLLASVKICSLPPTQHSHSDFCSPSPCIRDTHVEVVASAAQAFHSDKGESTRLPVKTEKQYTLGSSFPSTKSKQAWGEKY